MHVVVSYQLTSNPSLQSVRFVSQTRLPCKLAPPLRRSLAASHPRWHGERPLLAQDDPPPTHKSCKLGESKMHVVVHSEVTSKPSLQSVGFVLQTRPPCKQAPLSRHSLTSRAPTSFARKKMYALARKKCTLSRAEKCRAEQKSRRASRTRNLAAKKSWAETYAWRDFFAPDFLPLGSASGPVSLAGPLHARPDG
jgi:hypothetical protein